jgi:hypothetical protein
VRRPNRELLRLPWAAWAGARWTASTGRSPAAASG